MRVRDQTTSAILAVLMSLSWDITIGQNSWADRAYFHELFRYNVQGSNKNGHLFVEPDTMAMDPTDREHHVAMFHAHDYLYNNYAQLYKYQKEIVGLRSDKSALNQRIAERFGQDTAFQQLYLRSVNKEMVAPLHIDSALRIISHFYYVHKVDGKPTVHICIGINKVKELSGSEAHPYHAAFCYMVIREMDDLQLPYQNVREPFTAEVKAGVSDERMLAIEEEIYVRIAGLPMMRKVLIDAHSRKAKYLNFELVY